MEFLANNLNHIRCKHLQVLLCKCCTTKGVLLNCIPIFFQSMLLSKKSLFDPISLELYTPFNFQLIIYSVLVSFYFIVLNVKIDKQTYF